MVILEYKGELIVEEKEISTNIVDLKDIINTFNFYKEKYEEALNNIRLEEAKVIELRKEINSIYNHSLMVLSDSAMEKVKAFRKEHYHLCNNSDEFIYHISSTGIETFLDITCPCCGEKEIIV
jgi:heme oxygenase